MNDLYMEHFKLLTTRLKQTEILSENDIAQICQYFEAETIPKNQYFLEAGERCSRVGFLQNGILCSYILSSEGEEVVKHFIEPGQFFTDIESYEHKKPSNLNIQAVVDSEIAYISREDIHKLESRVPEWKQVQHIFSAQALNNMIRMQNFLHFGSAADKYHHFVNEHPELAQQVPLKFIASYLGITQSSLSRLRREK